MHASSAGSRPGLRPWLLVSVLGLLASLGCSFREPELAPAVVTEAVAFDPDDPAIWIHPQDPSQSLILGTDKGGYIYVFDLQGRILADKTVSGLGSVNNVDVEYGLLLGGAPTDIAVATDRDRRTLRIFRLPDMAPLDNGGIPVFEGLEGDHSLPMGVALYRRQWDGAVFAILSRESGTSGSYLWQYRLVAADDASVRAVKTREFGLWSGVGEIEAVAVDDELGYIYYSDENSGIRKYNADPDAPDADAQLALFGTAGFGRDREGISIYPVADGTGYILVTDQEADRLRIFRREGAPGDPHRHEQVKVVDMSTVHSDGCEVTNVPLNDQFTTGMFVAMSDNGTFHFYSWQQIAGGELAVAPRGLLPGASALHPSTDGGIYLLAGIRSSLGEARCPSKRDSPLLAHGAKEDHALTSPDSNPSVKI